MQACEPVLGPDIEKSSVAPMPLSAPQTVCVSGGMGAILNRGKASRRLIADRAVKDYHYTRSLTRSCTEQRSL